MKPTRAQRVRLALAEAAHPCTTGEIVQRVHAHCDRNRWQRDAGNLIHFTVNGMFREGQLCRAGEGRAHVYSLRTDGKSPEQIEARAKKTEYERKRRRKQPGCRSMEQYLADNAAKRARKAAEEQAAREAKALERAKRTAREAARRAVAQEAREDAQRRREALDRARAVVRKMKAEQKPSKSRPAKQQPTLAAIKLGPAPKPEQPEPETVEQWMARTGKRPEVLQPGAWSTPLRYTGHRGANERSWREREAAAA